MRPVSPSARLSLRTRLAVPVILSASFLLASARAETCTTQSAMPPAQRTAIADAARNLALKVQANDAAALRTSAAPDLAKDFGALQYLVAVTAPKLAGAAPAVEQIYLLDATNLKRNADGSGVDSDFFCSLNKTTAETEFIIPALPPGLYAFAMVALAPSSPNAAPWRLSFLMRQDPPGSGPWQLAGFYPRPLSAAGHDGLWFWTQARQLVKEKQPWNAWLYYREAEKLLSPSDFVTSTHFEKLRTEASSAAPPALSEGVSPDTPLVVKGADGAEYRFTALEIDDSTTPSALDLAVHYRTEPLSDQVAARKRNDSAAAALLAAYSELRRPYHSVVVIADSPGQAPFTSEQPVTEIK